MSNLQTATHDRRQDDVPTTISATASTSYNQGISKSTTRWPWLDPSLPQILPKFSKRSKDPVPILQGLQFVKEQAAQRKRKFVETVELHAKLAVDPRQGDQMVRGAVVMPYGTGKTVRVCVFARGSDAEAAQAAGADVIGDEALIKDIIESRGGCISFDRIVATPDFMKLLATAGKVLGPRGLMPNPKVGTVTTDVSGVVKELKRGRLEFRIDKQALLHVAVGKVDFEVGHLHANIGALTAALLESKPKAVKGGPGLAGYVESVHLCTSMGPSVAVAPDSLLSAAQAVRA